MSEVVFRPLVGEGFEWINTLDDSEYDTFLEFDGAPRAPTWKPICVKRVRADKRSAFMPSDFPWLGAHALIMRRSAVDALRDLFDADGELLPLSTTDGIELFVFNARVIDAMDRPNSSLELYPGTDRIMRVKQLALLGPALSRAALFRLAHRGSPTYVTSRFVERYEAAGLSGLTFKHVWSSDT